MNWLHPLMKVLPKKILKDFNRAVPERIIFFYPIGSICFNEKENCPSSFVFVSLGPSPMPFYEVNKNCNVSVMKDTNFGI